MPKSYDVIMIVEIAAMVGSIWSRIRANAYRVVDAMIFPTIPSGNINAPAMMVGERAAALMAAR